MTPLQVLPQFVEVLGKKIDKIQLELDSPWICFYKWQFDLAPLIIQERLNDVKTTQAKGLLGNMWY